MFFAVDHKINEISIYYKYDNLSFVTDELDVVKH